MQGADFSHLALFSARIGDAWPIIASCSGRATMGAQPWPARSLACVSPAVKNTPNDGMRGGTVQSVMDAVTVHGTLMIVMTTRAKDANNFVKASH